jgi:hypothetical protein
MEPILLYNTFQNNCHWLVSARFPNTVSLRRSTFFLKFQHPRPHRSPLHKMNKYMLILPILLVALDLATATSKVQFSKMNALKNSSSLHIIKILKRTLAGSSSIYI